MCRTCSACSRTLSKLIELPGAGAVRASSRWGPPILLQLGIARFLAPGGRLREIWGTDARVCHQIIQVGTGGDEPCVTSPPFVKDGMRADQQTQHTASCMPYVPSGLDRQGSRCAIDDAGTPLRCAAPARYQHHGVRHAWARGFQPSACHATLRSLFMPW